MPIKLPKITRLVPGYPTYIETPNTCKYVKALSDTDEPYYETECGHALVFIEGGIKENGYQYCPYCAGEIYQRKIGQNNKGGKR